MIIFIVDEGGDDSAETLGAMSGGDRLYDARGLEGGLELGVRIRVRIRVCVMAEAWRLPISNFRLMIS